MMGVLTDGGSRKARLWGCAKIGWVCLIYRGQDALLALIPAWLAGLTLACPESVKDLAPLDSLFSRVLNCVNPNNKIC